jgi:DNA polymerase-3 subunit gamma/tau
VAIALYRKYRSKSLGEIIGQDHVTSILSEAIKQGKISHAYLLTGPRGVGKTSIARILAHEINNLSYDDTSNHLDIIEIDAASNNGVEDVRDLRDKVQIAPVSAQKKIYIIDEVHMLTKSAFNALLKTLEEPPEHVVFILATTDVEKIPATIISRTQRFSFRSIGTKDAVEHLSDIAKKESISVTDDALELIAERGDGSFRDSISLLDQLSSLADEKKGITVELIESALGLAPKVIVETLLRAVQDHDIATIVETLDTAKEDGVNSIVLATQLTTAIRINIAEYPQLLNVLDGLLDVAKSSQPDLKLLSILGTASVVKSSPKSAALSSPVLEVSASIAELEKVAIQEKPQNTVISDPISASEIIIDETVSSTDPSVFNWSTFIEHTRQNYVAIFSVLSKCNHILEDKDLTIYTGNKFYKKKMDDAKYSSLLYKSLEDIGVYGLTIHTIPTAPPPKDSQAATVAVIMGGGEEVVIEDAS